MTNELVLKPISDLLDESFFIPAYQRGYRWTRRQVTELLCDIREFQQASEDCSKSVFYCLQPVVVKKRENEWELVDGQQRLTTIHIILSCLKDIVSLLGKDRYRIRYETRPNSASFLNDIKEEGSQSNIDFFHMYEAKQAILEWFESQDGTYKLKFLQTLLSDDENGKNVKVIWYQVNENIDVTSVFTRLNLGKIPLTNAELVKALFLKGANFNDSDRYLGQLKIAQEWDEIERALQADGFWFFISNESVESNRIEFVLGLVAKQMPHGDAAISEYDQFYVFLMFSECLSGSGGSIDVHWGEVKRCFMILREWYQDRTIFHLVGFLVTRDETVMTLLNIYLECSTKKEFLCRLTDLVFKKTFQVYKGLDSYHSDSDLKEFVEERLEQLTYRSARTQLVSVLLLFNIATLLENPKTNARFQFDCFKGESWDIEHISSVVSEMPNNKSQQKLWLERVVSYMSADLDVSISSNNKSPELNSILVESKSVLDNKTFDSVAFESLFQRIHAIYEKDADEDVDHSIGNLTLLDSSTNRSYQNAIFPIKRNRIIALDRTATFVPVCTKNVFLKYYSARVDDVVFWYSKDSESHQSAMAELLVALFVSKGLVA